MANDEREKNMRWRTQKQKGQKCEKGKKDGLVRRERRREERRRCLLAGLRDADPATGGGDHSDGEARVATVACSDDIRSKKRWGKRWEKNWGKRWEKKEEKEKREREETKKRRKEGMGEEKKEKENRGEVEGSTEMAKKRKGKERKGKKRKKKRKREKGGTVVLLGNVAAVGIDGRDGLALLQNVNQCLFTKKTKIE
jgi:hypothetical protein